VSVPENCLDCRLHSVANDRDPNDSFCDDDQAVFCTMTPNQKRDVASKWLSDRSVFRAVAMSCRPYNLRKESARPDWCPIAPQGRPMHPEDIGLTAEGKLP